MKILSRILSEALWFSAMGALGLAIGWLFDLAPRFW